MATFQETLERQRDPLPAIAADLPKIESSVRLTNWTSVGIVDLFTFQLKWLAATAITAAVVGIPLAILYGIATRH